MEEILRWGDGTQYSLYAYVVMPNHVHVLFMPLTEFNSFKLVQTWKSIGARRINAVTGRTGHLWQSESYDHLVRNVEEFNRIRAYIRGNDPRKAYDAYAFLEE